MATIEIVSWKDGFADLPSRKWDWCELKLWLRRGIKASPSEIKQLTRQIQSLQPVTLNQVHDDAIYKLTNILQRMGADLHVLMELSNKKQLFKNCPPR